MKAPFKIGRGMLAFLTVLCLLSVPGAVVAGGLEEAGWQELVDGLEDPEHTEPIVLPGDVDIQDHGLRICGPEGREKVLDLNGHRLECKGGSNHADLRLTDSAGGGALVLNGAFYNYQRLTIDGANVAGGRGHLTNYYTGTLHLISGSVSREEGECALENRGGVCVVDGGTVRGGGTAIKSIEGQELYPIYLYDENGKEIAGSTGLQPHRAELVINGGVMEGGLIAGDTDLTITGGTFRGWLGSWYWGSDLEYENARGERAVIPFPTYELHEENGEMKRGYWDVSPDDWFYRPTQTLLEREVLGYGRDGNFCPGEPLTRGQAAALLTRACGIEPEEGEEPPFEDVTPETDYMGYISAARKKGLLSGDGQGQFHPGWVMTRQEFAVLVMNAAEQGDIPLPNDVPPVAFSDEADIAPWAKEAVWKGAAYGLWEGGPEGGFEPQRPISRGEAAAVLARFSD